MFTRRSFLKMASTTAAIGLTARPIASSAESPAPASSPAIPRPTPAQLVWQDCEVGVLFSFDLPIAAGTARSDGELFRKWQTIDPALYDPQKLDTDQWVEAARAVGARYAIFTATHFHGFMQWQSDLYPYGVKQSRWRGGKGDIVADFVTSCRKAGIKPGLFLSTCHNIYWTVWDHYVDWGKGRGTPRQAAFNRIAEKMTEELCSRYGPLVQIWYDCGVKLPPDGGPDVLPIFDKYQPNSVFYHSMQRSDHRWIGNEAGFANYPCWATMPNRGEVSPNASSWKKLLGKGDPDGTVWSPGMVDVPLRGAGGFHSWFWYPGEDRAAHLVDRLVRMYRESVGRNCNLVIGAVITPEGLVPESDMRRFGEFGREIRRRFDGLTTRTTGEGNLTGLALPKPRSVEQVAIMEDIAGGERIHKYVIEGQDSSGRWQKLCEGESVGHKRIESFNPVEVGRIRLRVTQARATPRIRCLSV